MAYIVMAYIVMAIIDMAIIDMANIVMAGGEVGPVVKFDVWMRREWDGLR